MKTESILKLVVMSKGIAMKRQQKQAHPMGFHLFFLATAIILMGNTVVYGQSITSPVTRINAAGDKFDGVVQVAAVFEIRSSRILRAHHVELAVGSILSSNGNEAFLSVGPVWRSPLLKDRFYADVGIAPTIISGSSFNGRDLGGRIHFTTFLSAGARIYQHGAISLRIQHVSNGGLNETNPGMDMIGLEFSFSFSE